MKTLITGASGFVGQHLLSYLNEKDMVAVSFSMRGDWQQRLPDEYNAIVHLAGKAHDTKNTSAAEEYFAINTELTKRLFDRFLIAPDARDFIYFSSVKVVADSVENVLTEEVTGDPQTPYGRSKWQAEQYLLSQALPTGKRLFILRPCMIHGPGNKGNLNLLYKVVSKGIPWPLAAFDNRRSFLSIANLQFVVKWILKNADIPGGTYNLADDQAISTNDLIRLIGEARGGRKPLLWSVPSGVVRGLARIGDRVHLPLNSERLQKLTESYVVSNDKIKQALGISHMPVNVRDGLFRTLRSFRD